MTANNCHLDLNSTVRSSMGNRRYRVESHLDSGGQGSVYAGTDLDSGEQVVIKTYHFGTDLDLARKRIRFLVNLNLNSLCSGFAAPFDFVEIPTLAHISRRVGEKSLDEHLANGSIPSLQDRVVAAAGLARLVEILAEIGLVHGDLNPQNVRIDAGVDGIRSVYLIDFDNFVSPKVPAAGLYGSLLSMAPEARAALEANTPFEPTYESDAYSLAVLCHETIALRNPCHEELNDPAGPERFVASMKEGRWTSDPSRDSRIHQRLGGLPGPSINGELHRLFSAGLAAESRSRPRAATWRATLVKTASLVVSCPSCGGETLVNPSLYQCAWCDRAFPVLHLDAPGRPVPLDHNGIVVGREELGGSVRVSTRHAIFRRSGPDTLIEPIGLNPTVRILPNGREIQLEGNRQHPVFAGDRLRLGDVEVLVR
jgi:serine/threonine protein kinase